MRPSRVAVVTGAGRGLGRAIGEQFHAAGFEVMAADIDGEALADLAGRAGWTTAVVDVTKQVDVQRLAAIVDERLGRLDVLVNNAGIIGYFPVVETDPDQLLKHFEVNSFAALRLVHACLDLLVKSQGRVVNITSEAFRLRNPFQVYAVTKLALEGMSDVMRRELGFLGVHVATVRPGAIDTRLFHSMKSIDSPAAGSRLARPFAKFVGQLERHPPGRVSDPSDVARVVYRAATDARRRPHYEINNMRALKLAGLLPSAVSDFLMRRMLG